MHRVTRRGCGPGHAHRGGRFGGDRESRPFIGGNGRAGGLGPGRRGKRFTGEELRWMTLALIEQAPQHGYQLIRSFTEKSGEGYAPSPGVLYPLLTLMEDMGLVEVAPGEGNRRSYSVTAAGVAELAANRAAADAAFTRLAAMADVAGRTGAAPVRRAMGNLKTALMQRLGREGTSEDVAFRVAEILDAAAQQIERL